MGDVKGFIKYDRALPSTRDVDERLQDYKEIYTAHDHSATTEQAARCMDCGIPFCHSGCPLGNVIPDFNDAVYQKDWRKAYEILSGTNNFPEFTGRICPAPCEKACVLGINSDPVAIEHIEKTIAERAFENGWVRPIEVPEETGKKVGVVGSGPAGLAAAAQLRKAGHEVTVYERDQEVGGLLRYGIPDFKLEKYVVERRVELMRQAGIHFETGVNVGKDINAVELQSKYDAIVLTGGSTVPRDLSIQGRQLSGVHFAMEYLTQTNKVVSGEISDISITAKDKHVVVIGGGDTGADCVGTSNRDGAASVTQIELLAKPPQERHPSTPWPLWPMQLRTSSSHEEGCDRQWAILTKEFIGDDQGNLTAIKLVDIEWYFDQQQGRSVFREVAGSEREIPCDLALLAVGFLYPEQDGIIPQLGVQIDDRGNVQTTHYQTNVPNVFAAGDMRRGQSLVVWAISEGREAAIEVDRYLSRGKSALESKEAGKLLV